MLFFKFAVALQGIQVTDLCKAAVQILLAPEQGFYPRLFFPPTWWDGEEEECITLEKGKGKKKITAVPSSWDIFNQSWRLTEMSMKKRFFSFPLWLCCHLCSRQGSGLNLSTKLTARGRMGCRWLCGGSPSNGDNLFRLSVFIQDNLFRLSATS